MDLGIGGRRAIVTGGYRGTGAAIAASLATEGVHVLVHGFQTGQADDVVARIRGRGGSAEAIVGDILTDDGASLMMEGLDAPPDIVVCNYGIADRGNWVTTTTDEWVESYNRNVLSIVRIVQAAAPMLVERGWGRVILLGTAGATQPEAHRPHYYAAKGALPTVAASLAKEVAKTGVTVNLVSPGIIATAEILDKLGDRSIEDAFGKSTMTGRLTEPAEVADLVVFLCSEQAGAITGSNIRIDGGSTGTVST